MRRPDFPLPGEGRVGVCRANSECRSLRLPDDLAERERVAPVGTEGSEAFQRVARIDAVDVRSGPSVQTGPTRSGSDSFLYLETGPESGCRAVNPHPSPLPAYWERENARCRSRQEASPTRRIRYRRLAPSRVRVSLDTHPRGDRVGEHPLHVALPRRDRADLAARGAGHSLVGAGLEELADPDAS